MNLNEEEKNQEINLPCSKEEGGLISAHYHNRTVNEYEDQLNKLIDEKEMLEFKLKQAHKTIRIIKELTGLID